MLAWKRIHDTLTSKLKAWPKLVTGGLEGLDFGQFFTVSPTLSRQGTHAIFALTSHYQWRLFTFDAKTFFLTGDTTSRTKPIYAELPQDLVKELDKSPDVIARIKKIRYGLASRSAIGVVPSFS